MKKIISTLIVVCILFSSVALAAEITPYADSEFMRASASLTTMKTVSFTCVTYQTKQCIHITKCWLQQKVSGRWVKVCDLDAPANVAEGSIYYGAFMDYASKIGTGTYRVGFTVDADGHAITRYSNERTF